MTTQQQALEQMLRELRAADEIMDALDQHAGQYGGNLARLFLRQSDAIQKLRDQELAEWNATEFEQIAICDHAERPYHSGGVCEIYMAAGDADGAHLCEYCADKEGK